MTTEKVLTLGDLSGLINCWSPGSIVHYLAWPRFFAMITLIISHHLPPQHVIPVMMMVSNRSSRLGNTQDILTKHGIEFSLLSKLVCAKHFPILLQMRRVCTALFVRQGFPVNLLFPTNLWEFVDELWERAAGRRRCGREWRQWGQARHVLDCWSNF